MRILERDKQTVYCATYEGKTEKTKEVKGKTIKTGEYAETYSDPMAVEVFVSVPKGRAIYTPKGIVTQYIRNVYSETDLGLTEESVFWIGVEPTEKPNYRVLNVSISFHHAFYEIEKV